MAVGRGGDTARTVWKAVGDVSGRPGSRAGLRRRGQHKGERVAGAGNARPTSPTPASPGTWIAPPAGSSTQHQPRRPVVRAEADSAGGGPVGEGTRRGGPPVPAHDAGEWLHGKRQRVHTAVQNETGHQLRRRRSSAPGRQLQRTAAPPPRQRQARTANSTARRKQSRLLRWLQHAAETGTASSGARGSHRQPVYGERRKAARWRGDHTAPPLHTAAAATAAAAARGGGGGGR